MIAAGGETRRRKASQSTTARHIKRKTPKGIFLSYFQKYSGAKQA